MQDATDPGATRRFSRRRFLKWTAGGFASAGLLGGGYTLFEAGWIEVTRPILPLPKLPAPFEGLTVAFLTDLHHGPWTGLEYIREIVRRTNALAPDVILLGGDYVHQDRRYIAPCAAELAALSAPLGVYGVLGNHDHWEGAAETQDALKAAGVTVLDNDGVWLQRDGARMRLGGVGDLWEDVQNLDEALSDATSGDACLVLSHNPDFTETLVDPRVGLLLSGHTHGGQAYVPFYGAPVVPSRYGQKYRAGFVLGPAAPVYVSRGLGAITPPLRFACRPELALLTLRANA